MEGLAETGFADMRQVFARERRKAIGLRIGARQHDANKFGLLLGFKPWRAPIAPAIVKAIRAARIIADYPVP
jgi:hypothetical protein